MKKYLFILFYILLFCLCLAFSIKSDMLSYDIWSWFVMAKHLLQTGYVADDIFSYAPKHTWYCHEWLFCPLIYLASKFGGIGICILKSIICFLTILGVNLCIGFKKDLFQYFYLLLFCCLLDTIGFYSQLRAQNITFLFLPLMIYLLLKTKNNQNSKAFYLIPLLVVILLNCHAGSILALGILGIFIVSQILSKKPFKKHIFLLFGCFGAYFINPWGINFVKFMMFDLLNYDIKATNVVEWYSPFALGAFPFLFFSVIMIVLFLYIYNLVLEKKLDFFKTLILLAFLILAIQHTKHIALFYIAVFIFMYEDLKKIILKPLKTPLFIASSIYVLILCFNVFSSNSIKTNFFYNLQNAMPLNTLRFLSENKLKGRLLMFPDYSDFFAYKMYPDISICMDTRTEQVYPMDEFMKVLDLFYKGKNPDELLEKYKPNIIVVWQNSPLNDYLQNQNFYKLVYVIEGNYIYLDKNSQKFSYFYGNNRPYFTYKNIFDTQIDFKKTPCKNAEGNSNQKS